MSTTISLKEKITKIAPVCGITGVLFISICFLFAALSYENTRYDYSIFNHFISELGHTGCSPYYYIFSAGLCLGGIMSTILLAGFSFYLGNKIAKVGLFTGVISGTACFFVGVFPADTYLYPHLLAALTFFFGNLITAAIFTMSIYTDKEEKIPTWYVIPGLVVVIIGIIFLSLPTESVAEFLKDREAYIRPDYWMNAIFEWLVFFSLSIWLLIISIFLKRKTKK